MRVLVSVVNYHSAADVRGLLESIPESDWNCTRVCITDNSESPEALAALRSAVSTLDQAARIEIAVPHTNLGFGAGHNFGIGGSAPADVIVLANPDTRIVDGSLLEGARELFDSGSWLCVPPTRHTNHQAPGFSEMSLITGKSRPLAESPKRTRLATRTFPDGHFMFIAAEKWAAIGGFDADFFLYCEEIDLSMRGSSAGYEDPRGLTSVTVVHEGGGTTRTSDGKKSRLTHEHAGRSRVLLYRKHRSLTPFLPALIATRLAHALMTVLRGEPRDAHAQIRGMMSGLTRSLTGVASQ